MAGLARLLERYRVGGSSSRGCADPGPGYARLAVAAGARRRPGAHGLAPATDSRSTRSMRVLWPVRGEVPIEPPDGGTGINNVSVVLLGAVGRVPVPAGGRRRGGRSTRRCSTGGLPRLDLLKVAHHGSGRPRRRRSWTRSGRRVAVASAGRGQPVRAPDARDARPTRARRARASSGRTVDGTVVASFEPDRGMAGPRASGRAVAVPATGRRDGRPQGARHRLPLRDPGRRPSSRSASPRAGAGTATREHPADGPTTTVGYHRPMTVPGRVEAASLLLSLDPPPWFVRHARAVAEVAGWLAARIDGRGDRGGPAARGGRGPAPRRGQGPAGRRSGARPPATATGRRPG